MSSFFQHLGGEVLAPVLSLHFSTAIELGVFPQTFKTTKVIPIFKCGSKQILSDYKPISLLPNLSKIFEKFITAKFINFFENIVCFTHPNMIFEKKL